MGLPVKKEQYTFGDLLSWEGNERYELIDGEPYLMALPSRIHQKVSVAIASQLYNFLEGKKCDVYPAPFGVRLFDTAGEKPEDADTYVEPDISVVCDKDKLDQFGCHGAPDLVMEILSPSGLRRDSFEKLKLYQRAGVREYWIVSPENRTAQVFLLKDGMLVPEAFYLAEDIGKVHVLNGCFIELSKVFEE